jgi:hypoxanthine phosphoribosyltransferase
VSGRLLLTWADFDRAVATLAVKIPASVKALYGIPRGGLPLAVALSHATGLPLAFGPFTPGAALVDEIADSGRTLDRLRAVHGDLPALVWTRRAGCRTTVVAALEVPADSWIVFPWERPENAAADEAAYAVR